MSKSYSRTTRLGEELAHNISKFLHERLSEERGLVTCKYVDLSPDMKTAKVWLSFYPELKADDDIKKIIAPHKSDLVYYTKKRVPMKNIPLFEFEVDKGDKSASRIENLMEEI